MRPAGYEIGGNARVDVMLYGTNLRREEQTPRSVESAVPNYPFCSLQARYCDRMYWSVIPAR